MEIPLLKNMDQKKKTMALGMTALLLIVAMGALFWPDGMEPIEVGDVDVPAEYIIFIDEPQTEEQMLLAACASMLAVRDTYHTLFFLEGNDLNWHQMRTIENMSLGGSTPIYFTFQAGNASIPPGIANFGETQMVPLTRANILGLHGFNGSISVSSYEEALWAAPIAKLEGKKLVPGKTTYATQEDAWESLEKKGIGPDYIIVANPNDNKGSDVFYTEGAIYKDTSNGEQLAEPIPFKTSFHVRSLSLMAIQLAAHHSAWVLTQADPHTEWIGEIEPEINAQASGYYMTLKDIHNNRGPIEYVCLIGSAEAVPQFKLWMIGEEGDGQTESDVIYGFLTDNEYHMTTAVGRIINLNLAGASNQISRTLGYDYYVKTVEANYERGTQTVNWETHGSVFNGYEVADQRRQMDPGRFARDEMLGEGYTLVDYLQTSGTSAPLSQNRVQSDWKPIMESSGLVTYRGHGSWHATFYSYKPEQPTDPQSKSRLEGNDMERSGNFENSPSIVMYNLPPQVGILVSCENSKIQGTGFWGNVIDMNMTWAYNYLYSGAVGLVAATEVSYSNIGQDIKNAGVLWTDNGNWDLNNCWYGFPLDGILNHDEEHGTIGKAHQWAENRYINNPNKNTKTSPFEEWGGSADWKEVSMFSVYGDPAFKPYIPIPGDSGTPIYSLLDLPGGRTSDPWHNGAGEGEEF